MITYRRIARLSELVEHGSSIREAAAATGMFRSTAAHYLSSKVLDDHPPRRCCIRKSLCDPHGTVIEDRLRMGIPLIVIYRHLLKSCGFTGNYSTLRRYVAAHPFQVGSPAGHAMSQWMLAVLQGKAREPTIRNNLRLTAAAEDICTLCRVIRAKPLKLRNKALAALAHLKGIPTRAIAQFLMISPETVRAYIRKFATAGVNGLLDVRRREIRKCDDPRYQEALFAILHAPPSDYGINRTAWRMNDLHDIMASKGMRLNKDAIRRILRGRGYHFRKARRVLTSNDPQYREKVDHIKSVLAHLKPTEKFFSVDEFGPIAIKTQGGRSLMRSSEVRTYPQWQKSKGSILLTAALELSENQVTHFYSERKNTKEMIRLLHVLMKQYRGQTRIFFSWDAASWHASKRLRKEVEQVNSPWYRREHGTPVVELAPLPSRAQFLNVIESIFSGMARAVIHNSDYRSPDECRQAIDGYLAERNDHFRRHPRRAGDRIWGNERGAPAFSEGNNCKDPRWQG